MTTTRLSTILDDLILGVRLSAIAVALTLYVASFFGYGWREGGGVIVATFVTIMFTSLPSMLRDRRFFLQHWGFGLLGIRNHFPFQFFPGREIEWLNPLAWSFLVVLLLHFAWFATGPTGQPVLHPDKTADLRCVSLVVMFGAAINTLSWKYPPTQKPEDVDRAVGYDASA